jgi:lipopolysaccharide cholinephosphotransferase
VSRDHGGVRVDRAGLAGIHDLVRELLGELDRVATETGLTWYLAYGTALGAVRDGDLIPWDVDADVWLPRDQYDDLLTRFAPALGASYELLTPETHEDYEYLFPRLAFRGIHHVHVRVDIFPLDPAPRSALAQRAHVRVARVLDRLHFVKRADTAVRIHYSPRKRLVTSALRALTAPLPAAVVRRVFRRLQGLAAGRDTGFLVNSCGAYGTREVVDAAWFAGVERIPVAGRPLPVPVGHDPLLTRLYGDYRTPVSPEQQRRELEAATTSFVEPLRAAGLLPTGESS